MIAGNLVARFRRDEMATHVWLVGLIWLLIVSLWVLDMPTGPNACYQCGATEKLTRTFFSLPRPSGLIDDNGPFFGTWPAAALLGYSVGAPPRAPQKTGISCVAHFRRQRTIKPVSPRADAAAHGS